MSKKLVAYFSASGITAKVAEDLADAIGADIFEIRPEVPYTKADLNWMDKKSRSTIEMSSPDSRPAIAAKRDNIDEYDTIFVGFPICGILLRRSSIHFWKAMIGRVKQSSPLPHLAAATWARPMKSLLLAAPVQNCCMARCSIPIPAKPTCPHG